MKLDDVAQHRDTSVFRIALNGTAECGSLCLSFLDFTLFSSVVLSFSTPFLEQRDKQVPTDYFSFSRHPQTDNDRFPFDTPSVGITLIIITTYRYDGF